MAPHLPPRRLRRTLSPAASATTPAAPAAPGTAVGVASPVAAQG